MKIPNLKLLRSVIRRVARVDSLLLLSIDSNGVLAREEYDNELVHLKGDGLGSLIEEAQRAMLFAGESPGSVSPRLARGDQFFAWRAGSQIACFGWVTFNSRFVGPLRLSDATSRAFLYNFYTMPKSRGVGLYSKLLRRAIISLREQGIAEVLIDVNSSNKASLRGILAVGFEHLGCIDLLVIFDRWRVVLRKRLFRRLGFQVW